MYHLSSSWEVGNGSQFCKVDLQMEWIEKFEGSHKHGEKLQVSEFHG